MVGTVVSDVFQESKESMSVWQPNHPSANVVVANYTESG